MTIWFSFMSIWLWINCITTPAMILWPEFIENKTVFYLLWFNEFIWLLDMIRKFAYQPGKQNQDTYEMAINYMRSTLILDVVALLPQVASGLNAKFLPFKIIRLYQTWLLHYPLEVLVRMWHEDKDQRHNFVLVYAC